MHARSSKQQGPARRPCRGALAAIATLVLVSGAACGGDDTRDAASGGGAGIGGAAGTGGTSDAGTDGRAGQAGGAGTAGASGQDAGPAQTCPSDPVDGYEGAGPKAEAHATFHAMGLYWKPQDASLSNPCTVQVRPRGSCAWRTVRPLWFDANDHEEAPEHSQQYRGSVLDLVPGTTYEVRLSLESGTTHTFPVTTRSESFPISETVTLEGQSDEPLVIDQGGSETEGYVVYEAGPAGYTLDVDKQHPSCVQIQAPYVIVRGLTLRGAAKHGIEIGAVHHVVIEENDVADWGSQVTSNPDEPLYEGFGANFHSAIFANAKELSHVVVQRNDLHHPTYDTNSWDEFDPTEGSSSFVHPQGPQGITFVRSAGHHVIRYNHIHSDEEHKFNDGMGEYHNASYGGFPNRDSDIYGNVVTHVWDDAIEAEGSGMNVRVWANYVDHTFVAFGLASQSLGPLYLYRNVTGLSQRGTVASDTHTRGGPLAKIGAPSSRGEYARGRLVIHHNTLLQPPSPWMNGLAGMSAGVSYSSSDKVQKNIESRNNLLHVRQDYRCAVREHHPEPTNDFDHDLTNGDVCTEGDHETHVIVGVPAYDPDNAAMQHDLDPQSPGYDEALLLPGVSDGFLGAGPDVGAFEAGAPPLRFGLDADHTPFAVWMWNTTLADQ